MSPAGAEVVGQKPVSLREAADALHKAQNKWEAIGLQLGVDVDELESIDESHKKNDKKLFEMLKKLLTADENTTWKAIVKALRNKTVGRNGIANEIEKKYC